MSEEEASAAAAAAAQGQDDEDDVVPGYKAPEKKDLKTIVSFVYHSTTIECVEFTPLWFYADKHRR